MFTAPDRAQLVKELLGAAEHASNTTIDAALHIFRLGESDHLEAALAARLLREVARIIEVSGERSRIEAASARTDYAALLGLIAQPEALGDQDPGSDDALLPAVLAGVGARQQLFDLGGGAFSADQLAGLLGVTRQTIDNRRKRGKLLAVSLGKRGNYYPTWQVHEGRLLDGLDVVLAELRDHDPWSQVAFMLNPNTWLDDVAPLDLLRQGEVERVRDAASVFGEQIAA